MLNTRKTTLLKCIAHLDLYSGHVLFKGKPPAHYGACSTPYPRISPRVTYIGCFSGIPTYRTKVLYIPQRPSLLPLTPRDFVFVIMSFAARKRHNRESGSASGGRTDAWMEHPLEVGSQFGIDPKLWSRDWADLSGGEGQRIMMAIGVALGTAEILLLDGKSRFPFSFHKWIYRIRHYFLTWSGTLALITLTSRSSPASTLLSFLGFSRI